MTIKAVRAQIKLGSIDLDVFQLPDGSYVYSQTQAFISVADDGYDTKQAAKRYIQKTTSKQAQTLIPQGFSNIAKVKIEGENQTFNAISQADVTNFWLLFAFDGNVKAMCLLAACGAEALERRADAAFGVKRSEEERNARLEARANGKFARRNLTDCIKDYIDSHEVSDNYKKFVYSNCSDYLNKIILGCKAKQAKEFYQLPENSLLRDHIPAAALTELEVAERVAGRAIDDRDMEPLEAVKYACGVAFTRTLGLA